jgi:hypothetical protein
MNNQGSGPVDRINPLYHFLKVLSQYSWYQIVFMGCRVVSVFIEWIRGGFRE